MLPPASPLLLRSSLHSGWSPLQVAIRFRSDIGSRSGAAFKPKRRPHKDYRPLDKPLHRRHPIRDTAKGNDHRFIELDGGTIDRATLEDSFGPMGDAVISSVQNERQREMQHGMTYDDQVEEGLRMIDYYLAEEGSLEDRVGERRALAIDEPSEAKREEYLADLDAMVKEATLKEMEVDTESMRLEDRIGAPEGTPSNEDDEDENVDDDPEVTLDKNQLAHGDWSESLITVDRTIKLWRGGRLESYRALVIGGNLNGCGGFGVGKSTDPIDAVTNASRITKRNIFFVDRYQNGLTRDLVGKQNSCKVTIRARQQGLWGNELVREILKRFGIVNAAAKVYGKRSPHNVVLGTFKALMTHESLEQIAMKRGKRLMNLDKAKRLQL